MPIIEEEVGDVRIEEDAHIEEDVRIEEDAHIEEDVRIEEDITIEEDVHVEEVPIKEVGEVLKRSGTH
jgi:UDP-3-O-[3-hydroxymyristoyl] glucosamine N-acyltransferase